MAVSSPKNNALALVTMGSKKYMYVLNKNITAEPHHGKTYLRQGSYRLDITKFPDISLTRIQSSLTFFIDIDYRVQIILPSKLETKFMPNI